MSCSVLKRAGAPRHDIAAIPEREGDRDIGVMSPFLVRTTPVQRGEILESTTNAIVMFYRPGGSAGAKMIPLSHF